MNTPNQSQQILIPTVHAAPSGLKARHVMARAGVSSANAENSPTNPTFAIAKTLKRILLLPEGDLSCFGSSERNSAEPKARRAERAGASESTPG